MINYTIIGLFPSTETNVTKPIKFSPSTISERSPILSARLLAAHESRLSPRTITLTSISHRTPMYQRIRCVLFSSKLSEDAHKAIDSKFAPT